MPSQSKAKSGNNLSIQQKTIALKNQLAAISSKIAIQKRKIKANQQQINNCKKQERLINIKSLKYQTKFYRILKYLSFRLYNPLKKILQCEKININNNNYFTADLNKQEQKLTAYLQNQKQVQNPIAELEQTVSHQKEESLTISNQNKQHQTVNVGPKKIVENALDLDNEQNMTWRTLRMQSWNQKLSANNTSNATDGEKLKQEIAIRSEYLLQQELALKQYEEYWAQPELTSSKNKPSFAFKKQEIVFLRAELTNLKKATSAHSLDLSFSNS